MPTPFLLAKAIQVRLHLFIVLLFCEVLSLQPIGINRVLERDLTNISFLIRAAFEQEKVELKSLKIFDSDASLRSN